MERAASSPLERDDDWFPHGCKPAPAEMQPFTMAEVDTLRRLSGRTFDIQAWASSGLVQGLDMCGRGFYLDLLIRQARDGVVEWDPVLLAHSVHLEAEHFRRLWAIVRRAFFVLVPPHGLANPKMHFESVAVLAYSEVQRKRAGTRWSRTAPVSHGNAAAYRGTALALPRHSGGNAPAVPGLAAASQGGGEGGGVSGVSLSSEFIAGQVTDKPKRPSLAADGEGVKRRRLKAGKAPEESEEFAEWYGDYPHKRERQDAWKAWQECGGDKLAMKIGWALGIVIANDWRFREVDRIPYPASWIRAGGFRDEVEDRDRGQAFGRWYVKHRMAEYAEAEKAARVAGNMHAVGAIANDRRLFVEEVARRRQVPAMAARRTAR